LLVFERGQLMKKGDPLFTIVPDTTDQAVEMWVSGNDIALVRPGDHVRLQFEGWPAVQFAGWPSVAVGTFGGQLVTIDATDDGTGKFRVLVKPVAEEPWPSERFLRQGARANGWVLLSQVPLGYEIWRQLNGFPPVVAKDEPSDKNKNGKKKVPLPK
jgi:adhesin transport system membrane fusion protein